MVTSQTADKCEQCIHSKPSYGRLLCTVMNTARPVEYMRHQKSECGPDALLFDAPGTEEEWD
jgi:hypothetical protein